MEKSNFKDEFIAGNVGGLIGIFAVYPLDTAKIRMQVYPHYKSTIDVIRQMAAADGYKSLYRGSPAPIAGFGLTFAISFRYVLVCKNRKETHKTTTSMTLYIITYYFCIYMHVSKVSSKSNNVYDLSLLFFLSQSNFSKQNSSLHSSYGFTCREIAKRNKVDVNRLDYSDLALAGTITGVVQSPTRQIMERFKSVMQVRETNNGKVSYKWTGSCFIELIRKEGLRNGLFQGFGSVLLREVPQFAVYYPCYEFMKRFLSTKIDNPVAVQILAGGTSGVVQWLPPIYCFDVIKSKMQTAPKGTYSGIADCAKQIYSKEGIKGFFRGFTPAMLRAFPLHAIVFCGYETTIAYLKKKDLA
jgi:hypothetical protein